MITKRSENFSKKYEHYDIHVFDEAYTLMSYLGVRHFAIVIVGPIDQGVF